MFLPNTQFEFLGEGSRMEAYGIPDTDLVFKIFKTPEQLIKIFRGWGIDLSQVDWAPVPGDPIASASAMLTQALQSTELAWNLLRDETGLQMVSSTCSHDFGVISLCRNGLVQSFNTTACQFVVQERAEMVGLRLHEYVKLGEIDQAKSLITRVLEFIVTASARGVIYDTFGLNNNFGLTKDDRLIQLDTGEFRRGTTTRKKTGGLDLLEDTIPWFETELPVLLDHLSLEADRILGNYGQG